MRLACFTSLCIFTLFLTNVAFSQDNAKKSEFSISLVTGNITDASGNFTIEAAPGTYWLEVQFISYQSKKISDITVTDANPNVNVGAITLIDDSQTLSEVVVAGEKQQME